LEDRTPHLCFHIQGICIPEGEQKFAPGPKKWNPEHHRLRMYLWDCHLHSQLLQEAL